MSFALLCCQDVLAFNMIFFVMLLCSPSILPLSRACLAFHMQVRNQELSLVQSQLSAQTHEQF